MKSMAPILVALGLLLCVSVLALEAMYPWARVLTRSGAPFFLGIVLVAKCLK